MPKPDIEAQLREAKAGDILLFYRARGINRIITAFSRSRYYHVGMYAGDCYVVESRPRGVVKRNLRLPGGGHYFRIIPAPGGTEVGKKALEYAERQIGDGYAVLSVLGLVFDRIFDFAHINLRQRDRYSCGELVAQAFVEAGIPLFPGRPIELVAPWDFARFLLRPQRR